MMVLLVELGEAFLANGVVEQLFVFQGDQGTAGYRRMHGGTVIALVISFDDLPFNMGPFDKGVAGESDAK